MNSSTSSQHSKFGIISLVSGSIGIISWIIIKTNYSTINSLMGGLSEEKILIVYSIEATTLIVTPIIGLIYGIKGVLQNDKSKSLCILGIMAAALTLVLIANIFVFGLFSRFG